MNKLTCILLVDDDETTNFVNQLLLEDLEVTQKVLLALNGREALEVVKRQCGEGSCPQLILLDINMPVMNGFEFLEAYQGLEFSQKQSVVILMLTTSMNPGDVERLREKPIWGVLNKPLTKEMVEDLLYQHFNRQLPG
jgi:CheY-like chemotaxis protein